MILALKDTTAPGVIADMRHLAMFWIVIPGWAKSVFEHFLSTRIFDPSSTLNHRPTVTFPVRVYYCKDLFLEPLS